MRYLCAVSVFTCALFTYTTACSPGGEENLPTTIPGKVHLSTTVVIGRVVDHIPNEHLGPTVFTARMQVFCTLKGDHLPTIDQYGTVEIQEAGFVPGMCHTTTLEVGGEFIVYLGSRNIPWTHESEATDENRALAASACGLQMRTIPGAMNSCPPQLNRSECIPRELPGKLMPPSIQEGDTDGHDTREEVDPIPEHSDEETPHHHDENGEDNEVEQEKGEPEPVIGSTANVIVSHSITGLLSFLIILLTL